MMHDALATLEMTITFIVRQYYSSIKRWEVLCAFSMLSSSLRVWVRLHSWPPQM